jgi:single-strand DNA-binding protein
MLNRIALIGRLTADPELRYTNSGTAVASMTLAVDRMRNNANGERETDFINIVVWQKQAEAVAQYLKKGKLAAVDGRLQIRSYENREGQKVRVAEVVAELVEFLSPSDHSAASPAPAREPQAVGVGATSSRGKSNPPASNAKRKFDDDPFADDALDDGDLPF